MTSVSNKLSVSNKPEIESRGIQEDPWAQDEGFRAVTRIVKPDSIGFMEDQVAWLKHRQRLLEEQLALIELNCGISRIVMGMAFGKMLLLSLLNSVKLWRESR